MKLQKYVYFIQCEDLIKIGYSKNINKRLKQLSTGNGKKLKLIYKIKGDDKVEWSLHNYFKDYKIRGEWFSQRPILQWIKRDKLTKQVLKQEGILS